MAYTKTKTSDAQKRATQRYREKNRLKSSIQSSKSSTKTFINNYATYEDIVTLRQLLDEREQVLSKES